MKKIKTFTINNISHAYRTYSLSATTLAEKKKGPISMSPYFGSYHFHCIFESCFSNIIYKTIILNDFLASFYLTPTTIY